jgi:uncharacterized protein (UPF0333 family)
MFRILFVILAAAVITFSSILLGHYLTIKVAEAEAILKKAEAQAEANQKVSASLSEELIEYSKVEKWDGKLPVATGGNTFMDISDVAE